MTKILVTGGAGYIGSHVVKQLCERQEEVVILDNLSTGHAQAVLGGELIVGDVGDKKLVMEIIDKHSIDSVVHMAADISVPESMSNPLKYYRNNVINHLSLLECCLESDIKNFIFSSTAAVYGEITADVIDESYPTNPINPYGASKLMAEKMLNDACKTSSLRHVTLRYFNVSGADPEGRIGQFNRSNSSLTRALMDVIIGKKEFIEIFGDDYKTPDGTPVRDYVHVDDIAEAHLCALNYLRENNESTTLNCGYGTGYSVKSFVEAGSKVADQNIHVKISERRLGDPATVVANADKLKSLLSWEPKLNNLEKIIQTAFNWERKLEHL